MGSCDDDDGVRYVLSEWGCLSATLNDYGIDYSHITPKMGFHMVEDFMELMVKSGHVIKNDKAGDSD